MKISSGIFCLWVLFLKITVQSNEVEKVGKEYCVKACQTSTFPDSVVCHARIISDSNGKIKVVPGKKKKRSNFRVQAGCIPTIQLGLSPADLKSAYGINVTNVLIAGTGPTVAVVVAYDYPNYETDLNIYRSNYCLPECTVASGCLKKVNQNGAIAPLPAFDLGWNQESALDMQMVSAICPACKILLVVADNALLSNLGTAVNAAAALGELFQNDD